MAKQDEVSKLIEKVKKIEKGEKLDLSMGEDLSIGVMNLIAIEEHLFFSASKTGKNKYWDLLYEVREMRKSLIKRLIKDYEGEVWCISKHLLAASMRLMEVGTKMQTKGDKKGASDLFKKSYELYNLFWGINLGIIKTGELKSNQSTKIDLVSDDTPPVIKATTSIFDKLGQVINKVLDCCRE